MKRILAAGLTLAVLAGAPCAMAESAAQIAAQTGMASEEGEFIAAMTVVNCDEWVSLRKSPSTSAERVTTIPLGATVTNCTRVSGGFVYCEYHGMGGYVLAEYLEAGVSSLAEHASSIMMYYANGHTVCAYRHYTSGGEHLYVECTKAEGGVAWSFQTDVSDATELDGTDAFVGGTAEELTVLVYNAQKGLYALDYFTGEEKWMLPRETVDLGGSISHAVAEDGTMYIGGYYGPDPVAISVDGEVLWQAVPGHDAYWLYEIEVTDAGVVATYDCIDEHEAAGQITYGFDGSVISVEWF